MRRSKCYYIVHRIRIDFNLLKMIACKNFLCLRTAWAIILAQWQSTPRLYDKN